MPHEGLLTDGGKGGGGRSGGLYNSENGVHLSSDGSEKQDVTDGWEGGREVRRYRVVHKHSI